MITTAVLTLTTVSLDISPPTHPEASSAYLIQRRFECTMSTSHTLMTATNKLYSLICRDAAAWLVVHNLLSLFGAVLRLSTPSYAIGPKEFSRPLIQGERVSNVAG